MEPKLVEMPAMTVVGVEYVGKNEHGEIPRLWDVFGKRQQEIGHRAHSHVALGVCGEMRPDGAFSYVAGVEVTDAGEIPPDMVVKHVPAARYAVFTHHGPLFGVPHDLSATYGYIYNEWLPNSGYERAGTPDFELYDERFIWNDAKSEMDIYIPLKTAEKHAE